MPTRTTMYPSALPFVADRDSLTHDTGGTIDWASVADTFKDATGFKMIPAGHPMQETAAGMVPANTAAATCLLATNAHERSGTAAISGYGKILGGVIYENMLPVTLDAAAKTALQAAGTGFAFRTYSDSTSA